MKLWIPNLMIGIKDIGKFGRLCGGMFENYVVP